MSRGNCFFLFWFEKTSCNISPDAPFIPPWALESWRSSDGRKSRDDLAPPTHLTARETEAQRETDREKEHTASGLQGLHLVFVFFSLHQIVSGKLSGANSKRGVIAVAIKDKKCPEKDNSFFWTEEAWRWSRGSLPRASWASGFKL